MQFCKAVRKLKERICTLALRTIMYLKYRTELNFEVDFDHITTGTVLPSGS